MSAKGQVSAREYLRVSKDRSGRERSITKQEGDNRQAWPEWVFGVPYSDAVSASRYSRKVRGGYGELIADLAGNRFVASTLVLWEPSRGSRQMGEWVELIDACAARNVRIAITTHHRVYDPTDGRDRRSLYDDANDSEYESYKISVRTRRAQAANAAEGRPNGAVPFGYQRRYDPATRRLVAQEPRPDEAKVVVELFRRISQGQSIRAVAKDFEARGIRSRQGRVFTEQNLRSLLTRPLYIGERHHALGGYRAAKARGEAVTVTKAFWPGIIDKRLWLTVQRILSDPARRSRKVQSSKARHLVSMIVRCHVCGGPLCATNRKPNGRATAAVRQYKCQARGCVRVDADELDTVVTAAVCDYLVRPDNVEWLTRGDSNDGEVGRVRDDIAAIRAELDDLGDKVGRGEVSATLAARAEPAILARLQAAETRENELTTPASLRTFITPGKDVRRRWKAAEMSTRREVLRLLLVPEVLGEVRVTPRPKGWTANERMPVVERVVWRQSGSRLAS
jgi:DNA invertase Pin-like site-specific DNA recombinase